MPLTTPHTNRDLAARYWQTFRDNAAFAGEPARPAMINMRAGQALAEAHMRILKNAMDELRDADLVELLSDVLADSLNEGEIGTDGIAAYYDARAAADAMARRAA